VRFDFEASVDGWTASNQQLRLSSTANGGAQTGRTALEVDYNSGASTVRMVSAPTLAIAGGTRVTFFVLLQSPGQLTSVNPFVRHAGGGETKVSDIVGTLRTGAWNPITVTVPAGSTGNQVGVEFVTRGAFTAFVDSVRW
jgi:hypothetical protein